MSKPSFEDFFAGLDAEALDSERQKEKQLPDGVSIDDFFAYMIMHNYVYAPGRTCWPSSSVNSRLPAMPLTDKNGRPIRDEHNKIKYVPASVWLDRNRPVEQMTWAPGMPMTIPDRLILEGGWIERNGVNVFNLYHPPTIELGNASKAGIWTDHLSYIYPDDAEHIANWLAHRAQRPQEKINHALLLGGPQGIGKDTLLEPVKFAIGPWNFREASPAQILGRFNSYLKSVILRINEAHDLGEFDKFKLYEHLKTYTASPPDTLRVDEKHLREYEIINCCGVVITTNHKTDGLYLPPDDRRTYAAWSEKTKQDPRFHNRYWDGVWDFYLKENGLSHVAAYLMERDISGFDVKAPPPKTPAFWAIVDAGRPTENGELKELLDGLRNPDAVALSQIRLAASGDFADWIKDRKNRRVIPHRMEDVGYVPVRNPDAEDGLWKVFGQRQTVYAKAALGLQGQLLAARELIRW